MAGQDRPNFAHRWVDDISVAVHTGVNPSTAEWDEYVQSVAKHTATIQSTLVYTEGGSPSAIQRRQLRDVHIQAPRVIPCSVMTSSTVARAAITAFNLFLNNSMKAFVPNDFPGALRYLNAPESKWSQLEQAQKELKQQLGLR